MRPWRSLSVAERWALGVFLLLVTSGVLVVLMAGLRMSSAQT